MTTDKNPNRSKLPTTTKVALWWMLVVGVILLILSLFLFALAFAMPDGGSLLILFFAIPGMFVVIIYLFLGLFILGVRRRWAWIPPTILLSIIVIISLSFLLHTIYDNLNRGSEHVSIGIMGAVYVFIFISFLVPLVLILLSKLSYKTVMLLPLSMFFILLGSILGVQSALASYHQQSLDYEKIIWTYLHDMYGKAVEDRDTKGCKGCEEANQYFQEEWNNLQPNIRAQSHFDSINGIMHRACLNAIAYFTENISICECVAELDYSAGPGSRSEECKEIVQALVADNVTLCDGDYECTVIFAIMTDNLSLCDDRYYKDNCYYRYHYAQEDPYNYLGLEWNCFGLEWWNPP